MIGVTGQNHRGAIELFGQHGAKQHMRPGGAAKGNPRLRPGENGAVMPVGAANGKIGCAGTIIAMPLQKLGKRLGRGVAPMRVAGYQGCRRRKMPQQPFTLIARPRRSRWQPRFNLDQHAALRQPVKPALDKCLFGRGTSTANSKNDKFHQISP